MSYNLALITGASSGIGEALAHLLASKGVRLILTGRSHERLQKVAQAVGAEQVVVADLAIREERQRLIGCIREKIPDLVINNAGFGVYGEAISLSMDEQLEILEVNGAAAFELTIAAASTWIRAGRQGVVLNVSSAAGEIPTPGMSIYGATKAFVTRFSMALHTELAPKGISILVSAPGMVATDFANRAAKKRVKVSGGPILTPQFAAQQIWEQISKREEKRIFNWIYRVGIWVATHVLPLSLVRRILWNQIKNRIQ